MTDNTQPTLHDIVKGTPEGDEAVKKALVGAARDQEAVRAQAELREQIQSCFKRNLMQTEGDTELFDIELTIDNLLALISNREKLARIDEANDLHRNIMENPKWQSEEPDQAFAYARVHRIIDERIATLRKELDGGQ